MLNKLTNKPIRNKIAIVTKQIRHLKGHHKSLPPKVFYDQLEEMESVLYRLKKTQLNLDVLDDWCELNSNEPECRIRD
jgi:hypothetical protein